MFDCSRLKHPIIQAPMAGGTNTPEMVSAVINNGAVGSYGFAYSSPEQISNDLQAARRLMNPDAQGALNCNFFVFPETMEASPEDLEEALSTLKSIDFCKNIDLPVPEPPYHQNLDAQLEEIWKDPPEILTFHFGIPDKEILNKAHALDILLGITATCREEAAMAESSGVDFIVAQGREAGGHRGIFNPDGYDEKLNTLELINILSASSNLPLVAAGGIMNRSQLIAAMAAGACMVQMGTAFLTCVESGASESHKRMLVEQTNRDTLFTRAFSGRPGQALENEFTHRMAGRALLPFPIQNKITRVIRNCASQRCDPEYQSLWAGTHYAECKKESVAELIERMRV